ncbi:MAG TPA: hypothetical protein VK738_12545 [Terriglobales bacterium]|jgi:hypothetical protein|nr:hypothetical protein [Terriglobales bacterium]
MAKYLIYVAFCMVFVGHVFKHCALAQAPPPAPPNAKPTCWLYNHLLQVGLGLADHDKGYQRSGDVVLVCTAKPRTRLTNTSDIFFAAIPPAGDKLFLLKNPSGASVGPWILEMRDLQTGRTIESRRLETGFNYQLRPTCGTVVLFKHNLKTGHYETSAFDLLTNKELIFGDFEELRCSDDRMTIVRGVSNSLGRMSLYLGTSNEKLIADDAEQFNVSPNGRLIAFVQNTKLCVQKMEEIAGKPACVDRVWPVGTLVVSDGGGVVISGQTDVGCPIEQEYSHHGWPCEGLFRWSPAETNDDLVEFLAVDPQLISGEHGLRIIEWRKNWGKN